MDNHFDSKGGHATGKQVNNYGKLAVTESALASFFKILEEQQVLPGDLDSKLREAPQWTWWLRRWRGSEGWERSR